MSEKPTLVFVPGSWHHTDTWDRVVSILEVEQHKCVRVALPSTLSDPAVTLADDVKAARDLIVGETSVGHNVVVVVHSYGGFVGSSAVKGLTRPKQGGSSVTKDGSGHVIGMVMLASGFAQTGVSFIVRRSRMYHEFMICILLLPRSLTQRYPQKEQMLIACRMELAVSPRHHGRQIPRVAMLLS